MFASLAIAAALLMQPAVSQPAAQAAQTEPVPPAAVSWQPFAGEWQGELVALPFGRPGQRMPARVTVTQSLANGAVVDLSIGSGEGQLSARITLNEMSPGQFTGVIAGQEPVPGRNDAPYVAAGVAATLLVCQVVVPAQRTVMHVELEITGDQMQGTITMSEFDVRQTGPLGNQWNLGTLTPKVVGRAMLRKATAPRPPQ
jgi:hypothetical protein